MSLPLLISVTCALAFAVAGCLLFLRRRRRGAIACSAALGVLSLVVGGVLAGGCKAGDLSERKGLMADQNEIVDKQHEVAIFGAGCFWCVEPSFEMLDGVLSADSGYMGGTVPNPTYEQVCRGTTGHAEVVRVVFDPAIISYAQLVDWFFQLHDPTTLNRQGADVGTQYRSVIFTTSEQQQQQALEGKARAMELFEDPVVTFVEPAQTFYVAEDYHQDYFSNNPNQPYCRMVIAPKLRKLQQKL